MEDKTLTQENIFLDTSNRKRSVGIDGLRGIIAVIIGLFHIELSISFGNYAYFNTAYLGVEFFLVLSGFLIAKDYSNKLNKKEYSVIRTIKNKIIRLYPAYFVSLFLIIYLFSILWFKGDIISWLLSEKSHSASLLSELFCIQTTGIAGFKYINFPAWYVSALLISTFIIALLIKVLKKYLFQYIAPLLSIALYYLLFISNSDLNTNVSFIGIFPSAIIRALAGMMLGSFTFFLYSKMRKFIVRFTFFQISCLELFFIISFFALLFYNNPSKVDYLILFPIVGLIILMFSNEGLVSRFLSLKPFQFLGMISYSFYLLQSICSNLILNTLNDLSNVYKIILYLLLNMITAIILYYVVEIGLTKHVLKKYTWTRIAFAISVLIISLVIFVYKIEEGNSSVTNGDEIKITALNAQNEAAEGNEVWIKGANIDKKWYDATDIFSEGWIIDNGKVGWRAYDQIDNMQQEIKGILPYGENREIIFESNKWQGKANVEVLGTKLKQDGYNEAESGENTLKLPTNIKVKRTNSELYKNIFNDSFIWLLIISIYSIMLLKFMKKQKKDLKANNSNKIVTRFVWADALRIFCIFNVVLLHCTSGAYSNFTADIKNWYKFLYINSFTACAVPIFFMISGAFIIRKEEKFLLSLKKRLQKILVPLIIWSIIYILFRRYYLHEEISVVKSIINIPKESQYGHLWFIYTLCGVYVLSPVISYIYYRMDKHLIKYLCIILGIIPLTLKTIEIAFGYNLNISIFYFGFPEVMLFMLGKYLVDNQVKLIRKWYIWAFFSFIGYSIVVILSYYYSIKQGSPYKGFFSNYGTIPIFIMYTSLFIMFLSLQNQLNNINSKAKKILFILSDAGMDIYFIHLLIYGILQGRSVLGVYTVSVNNGKLIFMCFTAVIVYILSFSVMKLIRYIINMI